MQRRGRSKVPHHCIGLQIGLYSLLDTSPQICCWYHSSHPSAFLHTRVLRRFDNIADVDGFLQTSVPGLCQPSENTASRSRQIPESILKPIGSISFCRWASRVMLLKKFLPEGSGEIEHVFSKEPESITLLPLVKKVKKVMHGKLTQQSLARVLF